MVRVFLASFLKAKLEKKWRLQLKLHTSRSYLFQIISLVFSRMNIGPIFS